MAFPSTPVLTSFTGTDENPLSEGGNWTIATGSPAALKRLSNQCAASAADSESRWNTQYGPACEVYVTVATLPGAGQATTLALRGDGSVNNKYFVVLAINSGASNDTQEVYKSVGGVDTLLGGTNTQEWSAGDVLGFGAVGSTLTVYRNGTSLFTRTDSTYSAAGYLTHYIGDTTARTDLFGGGTLTPRTLGMMGAGA